MKKRCSICVGSGKMLGGGMMMENCTRCDGTGKEIVELEVMNKESNEYQSAKKKIKNLSDEMTEEEAEKLLDEELEKQKNVTRLKGRKTKE